jgi:hypothetical protein
MARSDLRTALIGAMIIIGCLSSAGAAPMAPGIMSGQIPPQIEQVSFWARPYPFGYVYTPGQCYIHVPEDTPKGTIWRRVWICTEPGGRGYGEGRRF